MKKYSTKNLYLCQLAQITDISYPNFETLSKECCEIFRYILAKREYFGSRSEYTDIFTGTIYREIGRANNVNEYFVYEAIPCITNIGYMTEEQLIEILKEKNPTFFEVKNEGTWSKKLIRTLKKSKQ